MNPPLSKLDSFTASSLSVFIFFADPIALVLIGFDSITSRFLSSDQYSYSYTIHT